ncbi:MAG: hypothetical protein NTY98_24810 [Verrucomicrobia bacterium]|nr:hypothetical protein [Verrucomicrobiota bacterium]
MTRFRAATECAATKTGCPVVWPHRQFKRHSMANRHAHACAACRKFKAGTSKHNTSNTMKTILMLIAAASVATLSSTALAAGKACEKCCKDNCAACCKEKGKACGKDCCKGE